MRVGENSGPVLNRLWTKVHESLEQRRRPFVLLNALADCLSRFNQQTCAIQSRSRRITEQI